MEIKQQTEGAKATFSVIGRLDTVTAPELESALAAAPADVREIILDFAALEYISSAGLRVLLATHKRMTAAGGSFAIAGSNPSVRDVFDITGFSDILNLI